LAFAAKSGKTSRHKAGSAQSPCRQDRGAITTPASAVSVSRSPRWVAEITGMIGLSAWPKGMRVIVRKERPHPGA